MSGLAWWAVAAVPRFVYGCAVGLWRLCGDFDQQGVVGTPTGPRSAAQNPPRDAARVTPTESRKVAPEPGASFGPPVAQSEPTNAPTPVFGQAPTPDAPEETP